MMSQVTTSGDRPRSDCRDALLNQLTPSTPGVRRDNLVAELTARLRRFLVNGDHAAGQRLPTEAQLSDAASVSRTVVREAIAALKAEGLIETRQGAGIFVRQPPAVTASAIPEPEDAEDIVRLIEFRLAVETQIAFLAAMRRTDEELDEIDRAADRFSREIQSGGDSVAADLAFHHALARASHNRYFVVHLENLGDWAMPRQRISDQLRRMVRDSGQIAQNDREHHAILLAVRNRDAQQAAAVMRIHLGESLNHYRSLLRIST